jgi:hypothetical protein
MSEISRWPLCWPNNVARTAPHIRGHPNFDERTIAVSVEHVLAEINRLNQRKWDFEDEDVIISTNVKPTLQGVPSSAPGSVVDSGVAIYFKLRFVRNGKWYDRSVVLTCDKWIKVCDNIRAIAKDIEAQRARQRWGCTNVEQAFQGYVAIPEKCGGPSWWVLLKLPSTATKDQIKDRYRELSKQEHPDRGGDPNRWLLLQDAYNQAMAA